MINFLLQIYVLSHLSQSPGPGDACESDKLTVSCLLACSWSSWPCNPRLRDLMQPRHTEINTTSSYTHSFNIDDLFAWSYHKLFSKSCVFPLPGVPELIILFNCIIRSLWCHYECAYVKMTKLWNVMSAWSCQSKVQMKVTQCRHRSLAEALPSKLNITISHQPLHASHWLKLWHKSQMLKSHVFTRAK